MEQIKALLTAMEQNAVLAEEIGELMMNGDTKAVINAAGKHGITLSQEDFEAYAEWSKKTIKPTGKTELTPEELDAVSGGGGIGTPADPYHSGCWFLYSGLIEPGGSSRAKCNTFACKAIVLKDNSIVPKWYICGCWGTERCINGRHLIWLDGGCPLKGK